MAKEILSRPPPAAIAQPVEQLTCNEKVRGSTPRGGTNHSYQGLPAGRRKPISAMLAGPLRQTPRTGRYSALWHHVVSVQWTGRCNALRRLYWARNGTQGGMPCGRLASRECVNEVIVPMKASENLVREMKLIEDSVSLSEPEGRRIAIRSVFAAVEMLVAEISANLVHKLPPADWESHEERHRWFLGFLNCVRCRISHIESTTRDRPRSNSRTRP